VISTVGDPRSALTAEQGWFLEQLGAVFAHVGDEGDARDVDGRYAAYFGERGIEAVINRPDFYVFGGAPSLAQLPDLVDELRRQLGCASGAPPYPLAFQQSVA
jgi:hypothetical protein